MHIIETDRDGVLFNMEPPLVRKIAAVAVKSERMVLHFHGGLVDRESGRRGARDLRPIYQDAGAYPIFFVWHSGLLENVKNNLWEIMREDLFDALLHRLLKWAVDKVAGESTGDFLETGPDAAVANGAEPAIDVPADVEIALRERGPRDATPGLSGDSGTEPLGEVEPTLDDDSLSAAEETQLLLDFQQDSRIDLAVVNALRAANSGNNFATGILESVDQLPAKGASSIDPQILVEVANEQPPAGVETLGIISTLRIAQRALHVYREVLRRYRNGTDSGMYCTVVDEILRALYASAIAGSGWNAMKEDTRQAFNGPDGGGAVAIAELGRALSSPESKCKAITLIGHSAGAIFIDNFLTLVANAQDEGRWPHEFKFQVIFLAPANTTKHFAEALEHASPLIASFRSFAMKDATEQQDHVLKAFYPRSLLYLISGVLERNENRDSILVPLVGLSRYLDRSSTEYAASEDGMRAHLPEMREFFADRTRLVLSSTADDDPPALLGFRATATSHGAFDDLDAPVHESLQFMIRSWPGSEPPAFNDSTEQSTLESNPQRFTP